MGMKVQVKGITVFYRSIKALDNVTVSLEEGRLTSFVGPNGAGKTTLLRCINRIVKPQVGTVFIGKTNLEELNERKIARVIGYVPQSQRGHLPLTVFESVLMGRRPYVSWSLGELDREAAWEALKAVGAEHLAHRYFEELSGGERQKVIIARALAQEPEILLLDEPTSNLDLKHQLEILDMVKRLARSRGLTVVMAMHDLNLACRFSDFIIMLKGGSIFAIGEPHRVLTRDNIQAVYGVDVAVLANPQVIVPLRVVA